MSAAWTTIVLAGLGTFAMRASFLAVAHRLVAVPPRVHRLLRQIPPAALAALVMPAVLRPAADFDLVQARVPAAIAAALVAWRTRNVALTLVVGMGVLLTIQVL